MNYWIVKTEPEAYSIDDLARDKKTPWEGVRNYQARNFLRAMEVGDGVLIYHSSTAHKGVYGIGRVQKAAYPDPSQFDNNNHYFDPKATKEKPLWYCPDIAYVEHCNKPVSLAIIKSDPALEGIQLREPGLRLSVMPVTKKHFTYIQRLGGKK